MNLTPIYNLLAYTAAGGCVVLTFEHRVYNLLMLLPWFLQKHGFQELSNDDYFSKNNEFAAWLKEEKAVFFSDRSFI